ncbi:hypothetical protein [Bacillus velezensis]|uniref:hypothetical protein n=1 Tax=Bacillus velezensis TaxID=492670 RepID=UPI0014286DFC|nr:hypothetical protein [Bacillus velezensis]QIR33870.1 hypothetical protein BVELS4_02614 [Bacillus velezensis]
MNEYTEPSRTDKKEFEIGDYVYLTIQRKISRIESSKQMNLANTMQCIRPATWREIIEYKKKLGEEA